MSSLIFSVLTNPRLRLNDAFLFPRLSYYYSRDCIRVCYIEIFSRQKAFSSPKERCRLIVSAGIGRYSGGVHGSNIGRRHRRRPSLPPEECDDYTSLDDHTSCYEETGHVQEFDDSVVKMDPSEFRQRNLTVSSVPAVDGDYRILASGNPGVPDGDADVVDAGNDMNSRKSESIGSGMVGRRAGEPVNHNGREDLAGLVEKRNVKGLGLRRNMAVKSKRNSSIYRDVWMKSVPSPAIGSESRQLSKFSNEDNATGTRFVTIRGNEKDEEYLTRISSSEHRRKNKSRRAKTFRKDSVVPNTVLSSDDRTQVRTVEGEAEQPHDKFSVLLKTRREEVANVDIGYKEELNLPIALDAELEVTDDEGDELGTRQNWNENAEGQTVAESNVQSIESSCVKAVQVDQQATLGWTGVTTKSLPSVEAVDELQPHGVSNPEASSVNATGKQVELSIENVASSRFDGSKNCDNVWSYSPDSTISFGMHEEIEGPSCPLPPSVQGHRVGVGIRPDGSLGVMADDGPVTSLSVSERLTLPFEISTAVVDLPGAVVEQATQVGSLVVGQVAEILPDAVTEHVGQVVNQVVDLQVKISDQVSSVADQVLLVGQDLVGEFAEAGESVVVQVNATAEQVLQVADAVASTAQQVVGEVTEKVTELLSFDDEEESDSDDEFESYRTVNNPEFRGLKGLSNFEIRQEDQGVLAKIYDFYNYMLKQPLPNFAAAMFSAPMIVSVLFTLLYLPAYNGLALDDSIREFFTDSNSDLPTLSMSWTTVFQVFMFSLSLSTGLQPELAPLSPYTLVVANINALVAQLVFVFLSGAVFARLSQPAQPIRCSSVALVTTSHAQRKRKENATKVLTTRYVLAGPQPCELVDVKVDLTYKYNTSTRSGSYFRATQSLKLIRPEIAFLTHGMLVRHVIDTNSPLHNRSPEMLKQEDAVFVLSIVGLERASMQSVFHVQHYCVCDEDVIWDAEFEDLILITTKRNKRVVDHSRLSMWRLLDF